MNDFKNIKSLNELRNGDIIRHKGIGETYIVVANFGSRVTAVKIADVTNAPEWQVYKPKIEA